MVNFCFDCYNMVRSHHEQKESFNEGDGRKNEKAVSYWRSDY